MSIGVLGTGLVGSRVVQNLVSHGADVVVASRRNIPDLFECSTVVLAHGAPHSRFSSTLMGQGCNVVSVSDDLEDTMQLLALTERAQSTKTSLVVGAACSPGMSNLLVRHVARAFDVVDEVHVAVHGTGGPACAIQHHDNLSGTAIGWHDGEWIKRPAGSGRELCWFPDPVNAHDCYRYATAEPALIQRIAPELRRITSRMSATRRDRLTARMPMMSPPHKEGGIGGLRVEVRGTRRGERHVEIVGMAERIASVAAAVSAHTAMTVDRAGLAHGVYALGDEALPNADILDAVLAGGFTLHQFVGF